MLALQSAVDEAIERLKDLKIELEAKQKVGGPAQQGRARQARGGALLEA